MQEVECKQCGRILRFPEENSVRNRISCPNCGSKSRLFKLALSGSLTPHRSELRIKAKEKGKKKPFYELLLRDDLTHSTGRMSFIKRIFDRRNDHYFEEIKDIETANITHKCDEPLSKHIGHGSAKYKK